MGRKLIVLAALTALLAACSPVPAPNVSSPAPPSIQSPPSSQWAPWGPPAAATGAPRPASVEAPIVLSFPIEFAETKGITVQPTDIGPQIVDGVTAVRAVDGTDWRIVAQCDRMTGTQLVVGVIKPDEFATAANAHQAGKFADNSFQGLLTCP